MQTEDNKRKRESCEEKQNVEDGSSSSCKRQKVESAISSSTNEENKNIVPPESNNVKDDEISSENLLTHLMRQDYYFSFLLKNTSNKLMKLNKNFMKKCCDFEDKYKEGSACFEDLDFDVSLTCPKGWIRLKKSAMREIFNRDKVYINILTPHVWPGHTLEAPKIPLEAPIVHLSPKWRNITIRYDFTDTRLMGIEVIQIFHSGTINQLVFRKTFTEMKDAADIGFYLNGVVKINTIEIDPLLKIDFHDAIVARDTDLRLLNHTTEQTEKKVCMHHRTNNVISIDDMYHEKNDQKYLNGYRTSWPFSDPLKSFNKLEFMRFRSSEYIPANNKFPLSLKHLVIKNIDLGTMDISRLFNKGSVLDSITVDYITFNGFESLLQKCPSKKVTVKKCLTTTADHTIILPNTLKYCIISWSHDCRDYYGIYGHPFLDFSLTDMQYMQAEFRTVLTLPRRCEDINLLSSQAMMYNPDVVKEWIWPENMEKLQIASADVFNHNNNMPESLKFLTIVDLNEQPIFPITLSDIKLYVKSARWFIDYRELSDIFIEMNIQTMFTNIFQQISHLNNLKKLTVEITEPEMKKETVILKCPVALQDLHIEVYSLYNRWVHIHLELSSDHKLSRIVTRGNVRIISINAMYEGILYHR